MSPRLLAALAMVLAAAMALAASPAAWAAPPALSARSAILVQPDTGDIVFQRGAAQPRAVASTTKLMTALLTLERANLDDRFTAVDYAAMPGESLLGLRAGERMTVRDLLRGLLLASGNDAATTLAVRVAGSQRAFVRQMNARARELGLSDTHYTNPIGLDQGDNRSSARDLVKLTLVLQRDAFFRRTVDMRRATLRSGDRVRRIVNRNTLVVQVPWVTGVKTGHTTKAGWVLVGSGTRGGVRVVSAVIGDPSEAARNADSLALLRYGVGLYRRATAVRKGAVLARPKLELRDEHTELTASRSVQAVVRRDEKLDVRVEGVPAELRGALPAGTAVGTAVVSRRGRVIARVPLVTSEAVAAPSLGDRASHWLASGWKWILLAVVAVGCTLPLALRERRRRLRRRERAGRRRSTEAA